MCMLMNTKPDYVVYISTILSNNILLRKIKKLYMYKILRPEQTNDIDAIERNMLFDSNKDVIFTH